MIRILLLFCCVTWCSTGLLAQGIVSHATGLDALKRLIENEECRLQLDVSPNQLRELNALLISKEVKNAPDANFLRSSGVILEMGFGDFDTQIAPGQLRKDEVVAGQLARILEPAQVEALRVDFLRQHLVFPLSAFRYPYLVHLGLGKVEIDNLVSLIAPAVSRKEGELRVMRKKALAEILGQFPDASRKKFEQCFGKDYVAASVGTGGTHESSIGVFADDEGMTAFRLVPILYPNSKFLERYPSRLEVSTEQIREYQEVDKQISSSRPWINPAFNADRVATEAMVKILSVEQRNALAHYTHLRELESDLSILVTPKVRQYLELPDQDVPLVTQMCEDLQAEINAKRLELELEIFKTGLKSIPNDLRKTLNQFYDNVWCSLH